MVMIGNVAVIMVMKKDVATMTMIGNVAVIIVRKKDAAVIKDID